MGRSGRRFLDTQYGSLAIASGSLRCVCHPTATNTRTRGDVDATPLLCEVLIQSSYALDDGLSDSYSNLLLLRLFASSFKRSWSFFPSGRIMGIRMAVIARVLTIIRNITLGWILSWIFLDQVVMCRDAEKVGRRPALTNFTFLTSDFQFPHPRLFTTSLRQFQYVPFVTEGHQRPGNSLNPCCFILHIAVLGFQCIFPPLDRQTILVLNVCKLFC